MIRGVLEQQVVDMKLENNVTFCGTRNDMDNVYQETNCVVISSLREGLPYTLLEAMTNKVPVIATSVGDIPCLIHPGETGYLVKPGSPADLENQLRCHLNNYNEAQEMAQKAYQLVADQYSAKKMAQAYQKVYASLVSS